MTVVITNKNDLTTVDDNTTPADCMLFIILTQNNFTFSIIVSEFPLAKIFCVIGFGGGNRSGVTSGFAAYQTATPDSSAFLIDLGNQPGLSGPFGTASFAASDSLHPYAITHGTLGALLASAVRLKTAAVGGTKRRIQ